MKKILLTILVLFYSVAWAANTGDWEADFSLATPATGDFWIFQDINDADRTKHAPLSSLVTLVLTTPNIGAATGTSLALSGNLTATLPVTVTTADTLVLTDANTAGNMHQNGDADIIGYTLPAAAAGLSACFMAGEFTGVITIDPYDGVDTIYLDGVSAGAGVSIDSPGAVGNFICLLAIDDTKWYSLGRLGTWVTTP